MFLGPVPVPGRIDARNVENAWQYSKVYPTHIDKNGNPSAGWKFWSEKGYNKPRGDRYPMGREVKPLYSYWDGQKLDYLTAREKIYIPIYMDAALRSKEYHYLRSLYEVNKQITLWDVDGYDYIAMGKTIEECAKDPSRPLGHAFVLAMMLHGGIK